MHPCKKILLPILFLFFCLPVIAQTVTEEKVPSPGVMVSDGKIYVVVAIVLTILAGLIFYVARLDKKISRLEKESI